MDESWRMRMGMPSAPPLPTARRYPPRRSMDDDADATSQLRKPIPGNISDDTLNPEDFSDVFGGPPRTVLSRQFSTGLPRSSSSTSTFFYEEIFRPSEKAPPPPVWRSGRSLQEFRIPCKQMSADYSRKGEHGGFYSDIFGWDDERIVRSRSRSKTSSSSVLSSEDLSPLRPAVSADCDDDVSLFASKLRPINVHCRWNSRRMVNEAYQRPSNMMPPFSGNNQPIYNSENSCHDDLRSYPFGLTRKNASPETISVEPVSNGSFRVSADDLEPNSPSSEVCHLSDGKQTPREKGVEILSQADDPMEQDEDDEDDEAMSSYVIEISSDNRDGMCESNGVDEAIAWAKEKFQTYCPENKWGVQECETEKSTEVSLEEQRDKWAAEEETQQFESTVQTEMEILGEKIRLWSTGKEADIRLLLSSLHHILWPSSGWLAIPLTDIIETCQVKKAYQKARLCLHPDKLQQRSASIPQKYIAEKAFSVLQDAWAAFISQDVFRR